MTYEIPKLPLEIDVETKAVLKTICFVKENPYRKPPLSIYEIANVYRKQPFSIHIIGKVC